MNKIRINPHIRNGQKLKTEWYLGLFLTDVLLLILSGFLVVWMLKIGSSLFGSAIHKYFGIILHTTIAYLLSFYLFDLYNPSLYESKIEILAGLIKASIFAVLLLSGYEFLFKLSMLPRSFVLMHMAFSISFLYFSRSFWLKLFKKLSAAFDRVLLIGTPEDISAILESVRQNGLTKDCFIAGIVLSSNGVDEIQGIPVLGKLEDAPRIISSNNINRVIVVSPINYREFVERLHAQLRNGVRVEIVPGIYEILIGRPDYALIADIPLIKIIRDDPPGWYFVAKRIMDIAGALLLMALTFPLWILSAILIKLTSPGPVFFRQKRIGKDGKPFTVWKFRTMIKDAEKLTGPTLANKDDERITPVGKILRKYRIDELPQLLNVLKGDMSLVGPRPERVEFVRKYEKKIPFYNERHRVKPGITGLAQVWGNYATSPAIKLKYDLIYIYNRSILLDIEILLKTAKVVLQGTGV